MSSCGPAARTSLDQSSDRVTSACTNEPPISRATRSPERVSMSFTTTRAPSSAKRRAMPAPTPERAPIAAIERHAVGDEEGRSDRAAVALGEHHGEVRRQRIRDAQEEFQVEIRARAVLGISGAVAAVEEFPVAPFDRVALEPAQL